MDSQDRNIPKSRLARSARFGLRAGFEGARFAGAKASGVVRSRDGRREHMEEVALESAERMVETLGTMKGAAMKMGQLASFIDTEYLPDEYRELYQEKLGKLRTSAPTMPWEKVRKVIDDEYDEPCTEVFESIEREAFAAASIGQVHRAVLHDGRRVAVKIQYPGVDAAIRADISNAGMILRLAKAIAPGLDAKAVAEELKERVLEELDYEYEAQNQRTFSRAYREHPFIYVPDVITRLSRNRVLVTEYVEGMGFEEVKRLDHEARSRFGEIVFRFYLGSIYQLQHFNADAHPGNYLLLDDGRVAFLDFGMTKRVDVEQIRLEEEVVKARIDRDPERLREKLHDLGFLRDPKRIDAERLMQHVDAVGGWYLEDGEREVTSEYVMGVIAAMSDPRSDFYALMRRENVPANELMGRRMEIGVLAVLGQLGARRNWHRIAREWWFRDPPATELGRLEREFWEARTAAG
jgi:predicted unusual protein kinase regulating ubiquinone biosynthesis (AarF/ABC1/UbiB family)